MEPTEQAPSIPPPKKRGRRWLIVGFVLTLAVASGFAWWNWPRINKDFIGHWGIFSAAGQNIGGSLTLKEDGTCEVLSRLDGSTRTYSAYWRVVRGELVLFHGRTGPTLPIVESALIVARRLTKSPLFLPQIKYGVAERSPDVLRLIQTGGATTHRMLPSELLVKRLAQ